MTVRTGSITTIASMRGRTRLRIGLAPRARTASICSVTAIEPSSAVIPAPTRPPIIKAVRTGPISRTSDIPTMRETNIFAPKRAR